MRAKGESVVAGLRSPRAFCLWAAIVCGMSGSCSRHDGGGTSASTGECEWNEQSAFQQLPQKPAKVEVGGQLFPVDEALKEGLIPTETNGLQFR